MQKRLITLFSAAIFSAGFIANSAMAQLRFIEGKDYKIIENPLPLQKAGENEVLEFFSYACGHCANLEPRLLKWVAEEKPKDVGFYTIPAVGGRMWTFVAQVKFTAEKLGLDHQFDAKYFKAIHEDGERALLGDKDKAFEFIMKEGKFTEEQVEKAWNSLQIKNSLSKSNHLWQQAKLEGVPALIVNGKYLVEMRQYDELFAVIEFLLKNKSVKVAPTKAEQSTAAEEATPTPPAKAEVVSDKAPETSEKSAEQSAEKASEQSAEKASEQSAEKASEQSAEKASEQSAEKASEQSAEKSAEKVAVAEATQTTTEVKEEAKEAEVKEAKVKEETKAEATPETSQPEKSEEKPAQETPAQAAKEEKKAA